MTSDFRDCNCSALENLKYRLGTYCVFQGNVREHTWNISYGSILNCGHIEDSGSDIMCREHSKYFEHVLSGFWVFRGIKVVTHKIHCLFQGFVEYVLLSLSCFCRTLFTGASKYFMILIDAACDPCPPPPPPRPPLRMKCIWKPAVCRVACAANVFPLASSAWSNDWASISPLPSPGLPSCAGRVTVWVHSPYYVMCHRLEVFFWPKRVLL